MARMHGVIMILAIGLGMAWLAAELKLWRWMAVAVMFSPLVWLAAIQLWDNTFGIPVSVLTLACYARFVRRRSCAALVGWGLGCLMLLSIHPMSAFGGGDRIGCGVALSA